ncbi:hypothetical protein TD95_005468 [Thielaviopsis punctulata]|uniref:Uncharacterized protein n=1 Tax=Thielaviopsis punctulata TaxID=72032 RepID=A0A0F4ZAZ8_9PEZI|nr:hypothetical protein TD95_005468 [Thielaviopsis punctulata]
MSARSILARAPPVCRRHVPLSAAVAARMYSSGAPPPKHTVLEKPTRFNPPSHGSRLPRKQLPKHYGPAFTPDEIVEQNSRDYPTMLPPEGTFAHWFWTSRAVHTWIAIGTLSILAVVSFGMSFAQTSPFKDLIPAASEFFTDPIHFFTRWAHVIQMHHADTNRRAMESRFQRLDDAMKRKMYQRAHGIEQESPITKIFGKISEPEDQVQAEKEVLKRTEARTKKALEDTGTAAQPAAPAAVGNVSEPAVEQAKEPRKKWLGLF